MEEFNQVLENASKEGLVLCSNLAASMGRPDILRFGLYEEDPGGPQKDAALFARRTVELARGLAESEGMTQ